MNNVGFCFTMHNYARFDFAQLLSPSRDAWNDAWDIFFASAISDT
jgi:hypothetical protein